MHQVMKTNTINRNQLLIEHVIDSQGILGFRSDGEGMGSTFYFELPVFATVVDTDRESDLRKAMFNFRSSILLTLFPYRMS